RRNEEQLQLIEDILKKSEQKIQGAENVAAEAVKFNNQFHHIIAEASHNQSIVNALSQMGTEVDLLRVMSWENEKTRPAITLQQHRLIFNTIVRQDSKEARRHMQKHIDDSAKAVLKLEGITSTSAYQ